MRTLVPSQPLACGHRYSVTLSWLASNTPSTPAPVWRRLAGFALLPIVSSLGSLIALAIIARGTNLQQWAAIAIGQSVGGLAALVVDSGWSVTGPAEVARATNEQDRTIIRKAQDARGVAGIVTVPLAGLIAGLIPGTTDHILALCVAAAFAATGFTLGWYAIGKGSCRLFLGLETMPRAAGSVTGAVLASVTGLIVLYPIVMGVCFLAPMLYYTCSAPPCDRPGGVLKRARGLRHNLSGSVAQVAAGAYSMGSSAIVGVAAPAITVAHFNAGYRLASFAAVAIAALSASLQAWVSEADGRLFARRISVSFLLHLTLGVLGFAAFVLVGPLATRILVGSRYAASSLAMTAFGAFFLFWSLETVTARHLLVSRGAMRPLMITTLAGSGLGIIVIALAAHAVGYAAAAAALAGAMGVIVVSQSALGLRLVRIELTGTAPGPTAAGEHQ